MSATITLEEAQAHLRELIGKLAPGEELVIIDKSFERGADCDDTRQKVKASKAQGEGTPHAEARRRGGNSHPSDLYSSSPRLRVTRSYTPLVRGSAVLRSGSSVVRSSFAPLPSHTARTTAPIAPTRPQNPPRNRASDRPDYRPGEWVRSCLTRTSFPRPFPQRGEAQSIGHASLDAMGGAHRTRFFRNLSEHKRLSSRHLCSAAPAPVHSHPKRQTTRRTSLEFHHGLSPKKITEILVGAMDLSF